MSPTRKVLDCPQWGNGIASYDSSIYVNINSTIEYMATVNCIIYTNRLSYILAHKPTALFCGWHTRLACVHCAFVLCHVTYPATCCASLAGVVCVVPCHLSGDLPCESCRCGVCCAMSPIELGISLNDTNINHI